VCHRPPTKPAAEDSNRLRGKKRLEYLQSLRLTGSNSCPSDAVSSGNGTAALQRLSRIGSNSYGEYQNNVPYKPECKVTPDSSNEKMRRKIEYIISSEGFK
jgi:hypothetical protein